MKRVLVLVMLFLAHTLARAEQMSVMVTPNRLQSMWITAIAQTLRDPDVAQLKLNIERRYSPERSPMSMETSEYLDYGRTCTLTIDFSAFPLVDRLVNPKSMSMVISVMTIHEIQHCKRFLSGAADDALRLHSSTELLSQADQALAQQLIVREEAAADVAALVWVATRHPADLAWVRDALLTMRALDSGKDHATSEYIRKTEHRSLVATGDVFAYADKVFNSLR